MLVPLDLAALAWKQSHLSPELALGWRLGRHAHECFDGLEQVRIAATGHDRQAGRRTALGHALLS